MHPMQLSKTITQSQRPQSSITNSLTLNWEHGRPLNISICQHLQWISWFCSTSNTATQTDKLLESIIFSFKNQTSSKSCSPYISLSMLVSLSGVYRLLNVLQLTRFNLLQCITDPWDRKQGFGFISVHDCLWNRRIRSHRRAQASSICPLLSWPAVISRTGFIAYVFITSLHKHYRNFQRWVCLD